MQNIDASALRYADRRTKNLGANWFYWLAGFSALNSIVVYLTGAQNSPFAFAATQWLDGTRGPMSSEGWPPPMHEMALILNLLIAAAFAGFGYLARRGNDVAFVVGLFLYVVDSMLAIGLRDFWGFCFHVLGFFFLFKGLLASRHLRENATTI